MALPRKIVQFLKKKNRKSLLSLGELIQKNIADLDLDGELVVEVYTNRYWVKRHHYFFDSMPGVRLVCLFYHLSSNNGDIERESTKEFIRDCLKVGGFDQVKGHGFINQYFYGKIGNDFLRAYSRFCCLKLVKGVRFKEYDYAK